VQYGITLGNLANILLKEITPNSFQRRKQSRKKNVILSLILTPNLFLNLCPPQLHQEIGEDGLVMRNVTLIILVMIQLLQNFVMDKEVAQVRHRLVKLQKTMLNQKVLEELIPDIVNARVVGNDKLKL